MFLIVSWLILILIAGFSKIDDEHYWLFCGAIYYFTYIYNNIYPFKMTMKSCMLFSITPNLILWWIAYKYNSFLSLDSISDEAFIFISCVYFYLIIHIICEYDIYKRLDVYCLLMIFTIRHHKPLQKKVHNLKNKSNTEKIFIYMCSVIITFF